MTTPTIKQIIAAQIPTREKAKPGPCPDHGEFEPQFYASRIPAFSYWTQCPDCDAAMERENEESLERSRVKTAEEVARLRMDAAGIPERYRSMTLEDYKDYLPAQKQALRWAKAYVHGFRDHRVSGRSNILVGNPGTGKTMLCACIAMALERTGQRVVFASMQRLLRRVKATYTDGSTETETQAIHAFVAPQLLVIDEVGVQAGTAFERNLIFDVLNERYELNRPTLCISNLDIAGVAEFLGDRIMDRMREGGGKVLTFDWQSYRDPKALRDEAQQ